MKRKIPAFVVKSPPTESFGGATPVRVAESRFGARPREPDTDNADEGRNHE